ncbi:hypothetical protein ABFX02_04G111800 [Erythranthe guttata]
MKISVTSSAMVGPNAETPSECMWLTNLDLVMPTNYHTRTVYYYRYDGAAKFFHTTVLKAALSRALVEFYPMAGRLTTENGRIAIDCNGEGVLFVEAECDGEINDMGDFAPRPELGLTPMTDYALGISTFPLSMMQVTRFKCGGVCLGVAVHHHAADGISGIHFINTWSDLARAGNDVTIKIQPPFLDRTVFCARDPPQPQFAHSEYHRPTTAPQPNSGDTSKTKYCFFKLTPNHIKTLKAKVNNNNDDANRSSYTTYEALAGHVWRCVSKARNLPEDQETKLYVTTDGRSRLRPPLPVGYFGNVVFWAPAVAPSGELWSDHVRSAAGKVWEAIAGMDNEYLRSANDYLEVKRDVIGEIALDENTYKNPNIGIISWLRLPVYDADFGWGKPVYMGLDRPSPEGKCHFLPTPICDGSLLVSITLVIEHMHLFQKLLYQI